VSDSTDPIRAAQDLTTALQGLAQRLEDVKGDSEARDEQQVKYGHRSRLLIFIDIALTVVLGLVGWQAHDASNSAAQNRQSTLISCQQTNVARAENQQLWNYVLTLFSPRPGETAAEKAAGEKVLAALRAHVDTTFAARDCRKLLDGQR
jgi:hypothetical protein